MKQIYINNSVNNDLPAFEQRALIQHNKWNNWISDILFYSGNKQTTIIIIDKFNHSCYVVENGSLTHDFLIELGVNYLNDKALNNDHATAEGNYYITCKKEDVKSDNYKSLLLNFPNKEDTLRFENAFRNNEIPDLKVLTHKFLIHGGGGKGYDWTNGGIALSNRDMDILYPKVKIGTRIVIVGTTNGILTISNTKAEETTL